MAATVTGTEGRTVTCVELPSSLEAAADARAAVRRALGEVSVETAAAACLLIDELVCDALLHVGAPLQLVIDLQVERLTAEVVELAPPTTVSPDERHATARRILDVMADGWGVVDRSTWFTLSLT